MAIEVFIKVPSVTAAHSNPQFQGSAIYPSSQTCEKCHPDPRVLCAAKSLNSNTLQDFDIEILRLSFSDSLRMTCFVVGRRGCSQREIAERELSCRKSCDTLTAAWVA